MVIYIECAFIRMRKLYNGNSGTCPESEVDRKKYSMDSWTWLTPKQANNLIGFQAASLEVVLIT